MTQIFKYRLPFLEKATIPLPENHKIIRVDSVDGSLWLWAVVNPCNRTVWQHFLLFKTGADMPADILDETKYRYIGCGAIFIQMELMMYIYEVIA